MKSFKIYINNKEIFANAGEKILKIAQREGIYIPALCFHCDFEPHESCRLCMVEVEGEKNLRTACSLVAKPEMKVYTNTPMVKKIVKINLELLCAQHEGKCEACRRKSSCKLYEASSKIAFNAKKYSDRKK